jgi:hypothetical protein
MKGALRWHWSKSALQTLACHRRRPKTQEASPQQLPIPAPSEHQPLTGVLHGESVHLGHQNRCIQCYSSASFYCVRPCHGFCITKHPAVTCRRLLERTYLQRVHGALRGGLRRVELAAHPHPRAALAGL